ncbi:MAG: hypothetical protein J6Y64_09200 [Ruminococcus sp.]|nr:hypothetical protein [Ruminococcus sp.]
MSFKRSDLAALGIEPEKIQTLIDWHMETVKGLQAEIDKSKDNADKLTEVQAELEQVKKDLSTANKAIAAAEKDDYKGKYEAISAELEQFKSDAAAKETATAKQAALKGKLKEAGYSDRAMNLIIRNGFAKDVEIGEDGKATNLDDVIKSIQSDSDFSGFTPEVEETSHHPANPPANAGGKKALTWDDIDKITDTAERQKAMLENMESLGIN